MEKKGNRTIDESITLAAKAMNDNDFVGANNFIRIGVLSIKHRKKHSNISEKQALIETSALDASEAHARGEYEEAAESIRSGLLIAQRIK